MTKPTQIKAWSFSRLQVYEACPFHAKLKFLEKIPEPERELLPGKTEHANERGSRIHAAAEDYVTLKRDDLVPELLHFQHEFAHVRSLYENNPQQVSCEGLWTFDQGWRACPVDSWDAIWLRIIIDSLVWVSPTEVVVVDYKSGKRYGNEIKHAQQMCLYALAVAMRYPEVQLIHSELWYIDQNDLAYQRYTKDQAMTFLRNFNMRALTMLEDIVFKPTPGKSACMFCPYGKKEHSNKWVNKTGDCQHSVL